MSGFGDPIIAAIAGVFGEPVTYTPVGGQPLQVRGVFTRAYVDVDPVSEAGRPAGIASTRPMLDVQLSQFPQPPAPGDQVVVRGVTYRVGVPEVDGEGAALLPLNLAPKPGG